MKSIVDNTFDTVGSYKDSVLNSIDAYTAGMSQNAKGNTQSTQADRDLANGNLIDYAGNKLSALWNKGFGNM